MAKQDVAVPRTAEVQKAAVEEMFTVMRGWQEQATGTEGALGILDEILNAETRDALYKLDDTTIISSKYFLNTAFHILDWKVNDSDKAGDGPPVYFSLLVETDDGEQRRINAGGWATVASLYMEIKKGWLKPDNRYEFESKPTRSGNDVLILRALQG